MLRDISRAAAFGDHPSVAAFMVAFRFSHFLRRILGEGALQSIFIPIIKSFILKMKKGAQRFFFQLTLLLVVLLTITILIVEITTSFFQSNEVTRLFSWMFPSPPIYLFIWTQHLCAPVPKLLLSFQCSPSRL